MHWFNKKCGKFWNAKADTICKNGTTDGVRQAWKALSISLGS